MPYVLIFIYQAFYLQKRPQLRFLLKRDIIVGKVGQQSEKNIGYRYGGGVMSNFDFSQEEWPLAAKLAQSAENYIYDDPNS